MKYFTNVTFYMPSVMFATVLFSLNTMDTIMKYV